MSKATSARVLPPEAPPASSPQSSREQRREFERFGVDLDVSLGSEHNFYAGFAENLSVGGVFVATHLLRPVGQALEICIHLPNGAEVRGVGEVRWVRLFNEESDTPPGMGVRFLHLEPGCDQAIVDFLQERSPLFFDEDG